MALVEKEVAPGGRTVKIIDKAWLREKMAELDAEMGFVPNPNVTAESLRALMIADGIRAEDNGGSGELMRMRYGDDWDKGE